MPTFAMALDLIDDPKVIAEYDAHHRAVWPEVLAALRRTGLTDMKIFRSGHHLFMTMTAPEGFDPATAFRDYAQTEAVQRWEFSTTYLNCTPVEVPMRVMIKFVGR